MTLLLYRAVGVVEFVFGGEGGIIRDVTLYLQQKKSDQKSKARSNAPFCGPRTSVVFKEVVLIVVATASAPPPTDRHHYATVHLRNPNGDAIDTFFVFQRTVVPLRVKQGY